MRSRGAGIVYSLLSESCVATRVTDFCLFFFWREGTAHVVFFFFFALASFFRDSVHPFSCTVPPFPQRSDGKKRRLRPTVQECGNETRRFFNYFPLQLKLYAEQLSSFLLRHKLGSELMPRPQLLTFAVLAALVASAAALSVTACPRQQASGQWTQGEKVAPETAHTVVFSILSTPNALAACDSLLMDISDPNSPKFGQHLSLPEVGALFSNPRSVDAVVNWINSKSAGKHFQVSQTVNGEYVILVAPTAELEELLGASFHYYNSPMTSVAIQRTATISIPEEVKPRTTKHQKKQNTYIFTFFALNSSVFY